MKVISLGVGRTGTYSLKLALERLGYGPCHHMEAVAMDRDRHVPLWNDALDGQPQWGALYDGFESAVDWPTAGFPSELRDTYPDARFILTTRSPENWADSFGSTIDKLIGDRDGAPADMRDWLDMARRVIERSGFDIGLDRDELVARFTARNDRVRELFGTGQILEFEVKQGWGPLCDYLDCEAPDEPFPRTNDRSEFWDLVSGAQ